MERKPKLYQVSWLNDYERLLVKHQCLVSFSIGRVLKEQVLCDAVMMSATHFVWGHPWLFDIGVHHNARTNTYSFIHDKELTQKTMRISRLPQKRSRLVTWFDKGILGSNHGWKGPNSQTSSSRMSTTQQKRLQARGHQNIVLTPNWRRHQSNSFM